MWCRGRYVKSEPPAGYIRTDHHDVLSRFAEGVDLFTTHQARKVYFPLRGMYLSRA